VLCEFQVHKCTDCFLNTTRQSNKALLNLTYGDRYVESVETSKLNDNFVLVIAAAAAAAAAAADDDDDDDAQDWRDSKLTWNESEYGGVSSITVPASWIWIPDVVLYNRCVLQTNLSGTDTI